MCGTQCRCCIGASIPDDEPHLLEKLGEITVLFNAAEGVSDNVDGYLEARVG